MLAANNKHELFSDAINFCRNLAVRILICVSTDKKLKLNWHSPTTVEKPVWKILTLEGLIIKATQTSSGLVARRHPPNDVDLVCSASWAEERPVICCSALSLCCSHQSIQIYYCIYYEPSEINHFLPHTQCTNIVLTQACLKSCTLQIVNFVIIIRAAVWLKILIAINRTIKFFNRD